MTSALPALLLVLLAAALHACWNALVRMGGDRQLLVTAVAFLCGILVLPLLPFVRPPAPASWPFIIGSAFAQTAYLSGLSRMYETGEFGLVYSLARGLAPLHVAIGAAVLSGETLSLLQALGVSLVSLGIVSLMFSRGWPRGDHRRSLFFALSSCATIALYSLIDGLGVRRAQSSLGYLAWLFAISELPFLLWTWQRRGRQLWAHMGTHWRVALGAATMSALGYGIVVWAMGRVAMAGVVSLRETSVVFAVVIGRLFMSETCGRSRLAAALLVAAGNVLIHL